MSQTIDDELRDNINGIWRALRLLIQPTYSQNFHTRAEQVKLGRLLDNKITHHQTRVMPAWKSAFNVDGANEALLRILEDPNVLCTNPAELTKLVVNDGKLSEVATEDIVKCLWGDTISPVLWDKMVADVRVKLEQLKKLILD